MKIITKFKIFLLFINIIFVILGCLFIFDKIKNDNKCIKDAINKDKKNEKLIIEDLAECQNDLFKKTNELEQLKLMPDARKDIINVLIITRDFEQKLGTKNDFSNECIKLFTNASRIPTIQEYVLKYKNQLFENNCNFATKNDLLKMVIPFQVKFLNEKKEIETKNEKIYVKIWSEIKYHISKLFIQSKIQKSELELNIENEKYKEALYILTNKNIEENNEFNKLYNSISKLKNTQEMIEGIYDILKNKNQI